MLRFIAVGICSLLAAVSGDAAAFGDEGSTPLDSLKDTKMQTLGGRQFWGDVLFFRGFRIQQNVFTGHYRLLDEDDVRHASGAYAECVAALDEIKRERHLEPMSGKAVILVHGIIRSSKSFAKMGDSLRQAGYVVFSFDYPSTRVPISDSARYLQRCIESLEGIEEINFVVHSMGGLVVRTYLMQAEQRDPRIARMVMLGVPNLGASMADHLQELGLFKLILGPAGQQLVTNSQGLIAKLPTPDFEFGILSGARGNDRGYNPLIDGDDDGTVELARTRLPGAADFVTVNVLHSFLMRDPQVIKYTRHFLQHGTFRENGPPQPIPQPPVEAPAPSE